ncbi:KdsC family phosphatase [Rosettibacter firmus]|uniref:KdsC family phosphatase n=1 Tax=Rosettibacter firmus TaxID=3111522 RepID=UPI00336C1530
MAKKKYSKKELIKKASKIKLLLTDVDGVLTDTGVYYSAKGEEMKRFSIRDGMGVERLRKLVNVETGIITREDTDIIKSRARKLKINELHLGIIDKEVILDEILNRKNLSIDEVAYIGDDTNDIEIMKRVGLCACPNDATEFAKRIAHIITKNNGGYGAFRDFAEFIIESKLNKRKI